MQRPPRPLEGHLHLHDHHVGLEVSSQARNVRVIWYFPDHLHAAMRGEDTRQPLAKHCVIVRQEHPHGLSWATSLDLFPPSWPRLAPRGRSQRVPRSSCPTSHYTLTALGTYAEDKTLTMRLSQRDPHERVIRDTGDGFPRRGPSRQLIVGYRIVLRDCYTYPGKKTLS